MRYTNSPRPVVDLTRVQRLPDNLTQRFNRDPRQRPAVLKAQYPRQDWDEITINLKQLREHESTWNLWRQFDKEGNISFIEIYEDATGKREGGGKIRFSPPPREPFWTRHPVPRGRGGYYPLQTGDGRSDYRCVCILDERQRDPTRVYSPVKPGRTYAPRMSLRVQTLHFGLMVNPTSFMGLYRTPMDPTDTGPILNNVSFTVDPQKRMIVTTFGVEFIDPRHGGTLQNESGIGKYDRVNQYKIELPFNELKGIQRMDLPNRNEFQLIITLEAPPQFFRKRLEVKATHALENNTWNRDTDSWFRSTDIVYDPYSLANLKVALHKETPVIDIGRWTTYAFTVNDARFKENIYKEIKEALTDFNIEITNIGVLTYVPGQPAGLWDLIDPPKTSNASKDLARMASEASIFLPFEVRYQLEVCISRGIINEYNITRQFLERLAAVAARDADKARNILEYVAGQEDRVFEPMQIFDDPEAMGFSPKTDIPHYCAYARKVTITPTTMYFSSPTVETTNRVLRNYYKENIDGRFLRVQFCDELSRGAIFSSAGRETNDELFTRVYRTLYNGVQVGDRHYKLLAWGNSQFREHGAYFFCETEHLSCEDIRQWMGNFSHIKVVAKYAARLGQCFSTTRAIQGLNAPDLVLIPDIEKPDPENTGNSFCFTDGVGKISPFLAQMIALELGIHTTFVPSAFQFRLGGCKGVLVTWPDASDKQVHIRKSQEKFTATYNGLEVIRVSKYSKATLNRQTISILSSLGVQDQVFLKMAEKQLEEYQKAMDNDDLAVKLLLNHIDNSQMTINIATMIRNGFLAEKDPFVQSLLHLWRSWSIKLLKEKARIVVEDGAFLLGVVDETGTLKGVTKPTVASDQRWAEDDLPQIFVQVPDQTEPNRYNVITGICLVGRNPSLHPGDLRVVLAVDAPSLHHLHDVVVFPSTGDRDIPSMCSGGDLDGDDFFVIWDKALQPKEWNAEPMNYAAPVPKKHGGPVRMIDLMRFFVQYMKNDSLPIIAINHLAHSDAQTAGVKDPKCLKLADLHSKAVDYLKTGQAAQMPKPLRMKKRPHFMEKKGSRQPIYRSHKILGQLYDKVQTVAFVPQYEQPFDKRVLRAYTLDDLLLKIVRQTKSQYDTALKRLMAQQDIATEFEVWSTFILSKPRVGSDYKVQEQIASLSDALKDQFRAVCITRAGGKDFSILGPFVAGMYEVTKQELDIALAECRSMKIVGGREVPRRRMEPKHMPLISFPWLFEKELGRIATGVEASDDFEDLGLTNLVLSEPGRKRQGGRRGDVDATDDFVRREDGVIIHRGEELILFDGEDDEGEDEPEESLLGLNDNGRYITNDDGQVVLATGFKINNSVPEHLLSGTGVEDVVPRVELEGLVGHHKAGNGSRYRDDLAGWTRDGETPSSKSPQSPSFDTPTSSSPISADYSADDERGLPSANGSCSGQDSFEPDGQVEVQDTTEEATSGITARSPLETLPAGIVSETHTTDTENQAVVEEIVPSKPAASALEMLAKFLAD